MTGTLVNMHAFTQLESPSVPNNSFMLISFSTEYVAVQSQFLFSYWPDPKPIVLNGKTPIGFGSNPMHWDFWMEACSFSFMFKQDSAQGAEHLTLCMRNSTLKQQMP